MAYMYVCPRCRSIFKAKVQSNNKKCPKCSHEFMLDLMIDDEAWGTLTCDEKRTLIKARMSEEGLADIKYEPYKPEENAGTESKPVKKVVKKVVKKKVVKRVVKKPEEPAEEKEKLPAPEQPTGDSWEAVLAAEKKEEEKEKEKKAPKVKEAVKEEKKEEPKRSLFFDDDDEGEKPGEEHKKETEKKETEPAVKYITPRKNLMIVTVTFSVLLVYLLVSTFVVPTFRIRRELPELRSAAAGDTVQFGKYKGQDEWVVLDKKGSKLLCISNYAIYGKTYDEEDWNSSSLRKWFNSIFINSSFNVFERLRIVSTKEIEKEFPGYSRSIGAEDPDKIFLVTDDELLSYLKDHREAAMEVNDGQIRAVCWIETD